MALQGTLDTFSLPDVLRLLATTSKTGRLRIDGDRGHGSVWLADGGVVDADAERAVDGTPTDEVVFELLRFSAGSFAFDGDDVAAANGKPEDVEVLLKRASSLLSEWTELEAVVPSLEHEVTLSGDLSADEVTIDAERWRSLVAVAAGCTVGELASTLGLTELGVSRAVRDLVDLGVADVDPPGTHPQTARRVAPAREPAGGRRPAVPAVDDALAAAARPPRSGDGPTRAGWLRTGEVPAVGTERRAAPTPAANGQGRGSLDDTVATPPPPPPEPPSKGGLASRLGRGRNASPSPRTPEAPTTGSTPAVPGGPARATGRTPVTPPARTNDAGRARNGGADAGTTGRHEIGTPRRTPPAGPARPRSPEGPARPAGPSRPPTPPAVPGAGSSPFDGGRLGPSPRDTGQIRPISPNSLPPDLHWAADDTGSGPLNGGPPTSPFSGLSSLGPSRPAPADGEIAPHVAAMSPDARAAVQSTVGNNGGGATGRGLQADDIAQRGRLISFLSTVR
ncbi:MAG TPA: DUF4388 domain-containing protein [Acidimicrobiales bacterium]|nr:DUF4388 domain-containing protein [Acidimicrobiales bacterium]